MSDLIRLPSERVEQLRELAANFGMSVSDTIGRLINEQIEAGHLDDHVPGFKIRTDKNDRVYFSVDGQEAAFEATPSKACAMTLADSIERAAKRRTPFAVFDEDLWVVVSRVGTSVKFSDREGKVEKTVSPSVALDIARLLRKAAT